MCSTLFQFCSTSCQMAQPPKRNHYFCKQWQCGSNMHFISTRYFQSPGPQRVAREKTVLEHNLDHKKLHAKRPIWSTIWGTKSCTRKHPSGARSGPQKVAREKTHLEHDLGHKKLHEKTPIWSTIWTTKSCTRKHPSGARSGPQKVARDNTHQEHGRLTWMGCRFWRVEGPSHSWFCTSSRHFRGAIFLFLLASLQLKRKKKDTIYSTKTFKKKYAVLKESRASAREVGVGNSTSCEKWHGAQKALHAKKPIWSTIWTTKSCTRKDPSGARFGAQKVAREKNHLEHDLEHKKLHAKTPISTTI